MSSSDRLTPWNRRGLILLAVLFVIIGVVTEIRWAGMERPKGDAGVYLRAAWAVRTGQDIYAITDHNGWHYHYPPLFAILLTPLASELGEEQLPGLLPSSVSVAIWFLLSVLFLAAGVHLLASALERRASEPVQRFGRRWWLLRAIPIAVCLAPIAHTLSRGQVNALLMFLLCGTIAAAINGQSWRSGLWLAGAICLKVIPAFLLLYPLWKRDVRALAGCAVGLVVGLLMIPAAVFGPERTVEYYEEWANVLIRPALAQGGDQARAKELTETTATKSQSFVAVFHCTMYPDRAARPAQAAREIRLAHWAAGGLLTLATLGVVYWRRFSSGASELLFFGSLVILMLLLSPICHGHYFTSAAPLVMGLVFVTWQREGKAHLTWGMTGLLGFYAVATIVPLFEGLALLRDLGLAMYASLALWLAAMIRISPQRHEAHQEARVPGPVDLAA